MTRKKDGILEEGTSWILPISIEPIDVNERHEIEQKDRVFKEPATMEMIELASRHIDRVDPTGRSCPVEKQDPSRRVLGCYHNTHKEDLVCPIVCTVDPQAPTSIHYEDERGTRPIAEPQSA